MASILANGPAEAERELDAATTRTAMDAAVKKLMRAKAELTRLEAEAATSVGRFIPRPLGLVIRPDR